MTRQCFECGLPAQVDHHVIPRSLGGTKTVPLCDGCHSKVHSKNMTACTELWKRTTERDRGLLDLQTAVAGLVQMADQQGIPVVVRDKSGVFWWQREFDSFAERNGWTLGTRHLRKILGRLEEIYRTDPAYYFWILHDRPLGSDVAYPWVGLVQIERCR